MNDTVQIAITEAVVKQPTKKSQADRIFQTKMEEREQGLFASNKEFRASVLSAMIAELNVSVASAATMYNTAKLGAEKVNPDVGLGRDPKKVKAPSTGKRGRPAGSKNRPKEVVITLVQPSVVPVNVEVTA